MTTPLFLLRCVQLGLSMADLELLSIGLINDMYAESRNDSFSYAVLADQAAMDAGADIFGWYICLQIFLPVI